jgi:hypothetical protein
VRRLGEYPTKHSRHSDLPNGRTRSSVQMPAGSANLMLQPAFEAAAPEDFLHEFLGTSETILADGCGDHEFDSPGCSG